MSKGGIINKNNVSLMTEIAELYYEEGKTQEEIGNILGISRIKVLRLLRKAREEGIVSIRINDLLLTYEELERELERKFSLEKVIVVHNANLLPPLITRKIGRLGALLIQEVIQNGDTVGVGWGKTMLECVKQLKPSDKVGITAVPLGGGTGQIEPSFQVNEITRKLASNFRAQWYPLDIPIFVENEEAKDILFKESRVSKVTDLWNKLTVAVVGIGNIASLWEDYSSLVAFSQQAVEMLKEEIILYKSVGNIVHNYFDIDGNICPISIRKNIIAIHIEQIKRANRVIALGGGEDKREAVLGALKIGFITHLVTDEFVANYLLEASNKTSSKMPLST